MEWIRLLAIAGVVAGVDSHDDGGCCIHFGCNFFNSSMQAFAACKPGCANLSQIAMAPVDDAIELIQQRTGVCEKTCLLNPAKVWFNGPNQMAKFGLKKTSYGKPSSSVLKAGIMPSALKISAVIGHVWF